MVKPHILTVVRPVEGGIRSHILTLTQYLHQDFSFSIACPPELCADFYEHKCTTIPLSLGGGVHPVHDLRALWHLKSIIKSGSFSLIHAHGFKAALLARPIARRYNVPCLVTVHGDFAHAHASRMRGIYRTAESSFAKLATGYIAVADWLAHELTSVYAVDPKRVMVIPNGIGPLQGAEYPDEALPFLQGCRVIGTVARLAPQKGVKYFVYAAAELAAQWPDLRFVVVGDGPQRQELEALCDKLKLRGRLFFAGYRQDVSALLARFHVFVQPSVSEGQGITALEAMAARCPVVASAVGGLKELIHHGDNGLLVQPKETKQIVDAVNRLLTDEVLRVTLAENGLASVTHYGVAEMVNRTRSLYAQIIEGRWPA